jgi:uncharacterized YigZ family protein
MAADTYKTIAQIPEPAVFKDRKSKFIGYAFPVERLDDVKPLIDRLKKEHHSARHWCYAYRIGVDKILERANDDGEPSNSAGQPILNQIKAKDLTNVLVVVVRYFGGVKLGVGGLINAYKTATQMVLDKAEIIEKIRTKNLRIIFAYDDMNKVMRLIKEHQLNIIKQNLQEKGEIVLSVRLDDYDKIKELFTKIHTIQVNEVDT